MKFLNDENYTVFIHSSSRSIVEPDSSSKLVLKPHTLRLFSNHLRTNFNVESRLQEKVVAKHTAIGMESK